MKARALKNIFCVVSMLMTASFALSICCPLDAAAEDLKADRGDAILVLMYTDLSRRPSPRSIRYVDFDNQMKALKNGGFTPIRLKDLVEFYYDKKALPKKSVLITFDDGIRDSVKYADKVLKKYGLNAVLFLIPAKMDSGDHHYLSWHEARGLVDTKRWEVGDHTNMGHEYIKTNPEGSKGLYLLKRMWLPRYKRVETWDEFKERVAKEYVDTKKRIMSQLKLSDVTAVSIPHGDYQIWTSDKEEVVFNKDVIRDTFKLCFLQDANGLIYRNSDIMSLRRMNIQPGWSMRRFSYLAGLEIPPLDYFKDNFDTPSIRQEWMITAGAAHYAKKKLLLYPPPGKKTGQAWLMGSQGISDYLARIDFSLRGYPQFWVYSRYVDSDNYLRIGIEGNYIYMQKVVAGKKTENIRKPFKGYGSINRLTVMEKSGNTVAFIGEDRIGRIEIGERLKSSLFGMEIWNGRNEFQAAVEISAIELKVPNRIWACVTADTEEDVERYRKLFEIAATYSPADLAVTGEGDIKQVSANPDFSRMLAYYYGMKLVPSVKVASLDIKNGEELIAGLCKMAEDRKLDGLNIDMRDIGDFNEKAAGSFFEDLHLRLRKKGKIMAVTFSHSKQHKEFFDKVLPETSDWCITRGGIAEDVLASFGSNNPRLIYLAPYKDEAALQTRFPKGRSSAFYHEK